MLIKFLKKIFCKYRRFYFQRDFMHFSPSSGVGSIGYGDNCIVQGKEHIYFGDNSWFGIGTELLAYGSKKWETILSIGNMVHAQARTRITCARHIVIGNNVR